MEQASLKLPIRLVPRKLPLIAALLFFGFFFGFSLFWMAGAAGILDLNEGEIRAIDWTDWEANLFPLFGLPFLAVGVCGLVNTVLQFLPRSPYHHLQITGDGVLLRTLFKHRYHAWRDLPPFETLMVEKRSNKSKTIRHYTVAMQTGVPPADAPRGASYQREVVRILANDYGTADGAADAKALADWLNHLRDLANDRRLDAQTIIEVPEPFRATAHAVAAPALAPRRAQTMVRR